MLSIALESDDEKLPFRMALRAPAIAWGLSRPVTPFSDFGCGSMLLRLLDASELAGLGVASGELSASFLGCNEARRFARVDMEDCVVRRGALGSVCCEDAPADAILSRKERREAVDLVGVSSGIGDAEAPRLRGLRRGSLEEEAGVSDEVDRAGVGDFFA